MNRVGAKIKRAGQQFWYGDRYAHFETREQQVPKEEKPRVPFTSGADPIEELGVMLAGTGMAVTTAGAALEFGHIASNEIAHMTTLSGLGSIAIGGLIYAYGKFGK